jgi:cell division protein FtsI/penicillin-binding protein 2
MQSSSSAYRSKLLLMGLFVLLGIFVIRLFYLQVIRHGYYVTEANKVQISKETIPASRGLVYAMDGDKPVPLVLNETVYTVFADPQEIQDKDKIDSALKSIAGGNMVKGYAEYLNDKKLRYVIIARQVSREQAELLKKEDLAGIGFQATDRRVYPEGTLAAQVLGFVNGDNKGQYGLEEQLNDRLTGTPGRLQAVTDVRRIPLTIGKDDIRQPAKNGDNLVLTIDRNIQSYAESALKAGLERAKATKGSILIMDPTNGAVMAMANLPTYDPGKYNEVTDAGAFNNGVISAPYEAGSVIKTLTMGVGLDSGAVKANSTYNNTGRVQVDDRVIRNVEEDPINPNATMTDILRYSLNTGVVYVLQQMGGGTVNRQARDTLYRYFSDHYRFGHLTGIDLANELKGTIISPDKAEGNNIRYANMTFGQGMDVTMIQTAAAFSASINGGTYYKPHVVKGVLTDDQKIIPSKPEIVATNVLSAKSSVELRDMIWQGRKLGFFGKNDPDGFMVGGKTGTSQVLDTKTGKYSDKNSIGSYLGFGGVDSPRYVIMVRVDDSKLNSGYEGTTAAGPIFNDVSNWMLSYLQLQPKR